MTPAQPQLGTIEYLGGGSFRWNYCDSELQIIGRTIYPTHWEAMRAGVRALEEMGLSSEAWRSDSVKVKQEDLHAKEA